MLSAKYPKETLSEVVLSFPQGERVKWGKEKELRGRRKFCLE